MSTVNYNELGNKDSLSTSDLTGVADSSGLLQKTTLQKLQTFLNTIGVSSYKGVLLAADALVSEDGIYIAGDSGTYTNNGGLVVDLNNNFTFISVEDTLTTFIKIDIPLNIVLDTEPTSASTNSVESGGVYDFGLQVAENKNIVPNADFSGAVMGSSLSAVSYSQYFTDAGKDTNGVSVVDGTVPLGLTTRALKIDALFGQRINNFTGTNGTSTILTNGDAFSCGIWVYNSDWSTYVSNGGYTIFNIRTDDGTSVVEMTNYTAFGNMRFYYINNQTYDSSKGGLHIYSIIGNEGGSADATFYLSTAAIIKGTFINPQLYSNFSKTVELQSDNVTKTFLTNDQRFQFKDYLTDKDASYTADELTIIDAVYDIVTLKVASGEESDVFAIVLLQGSATTNKYRIQIKNITTDTVVFDTYTSLEHHGYNSKGLSIVRLPAAINGDYDFLILIDWSKIPSSFNFINSLSNVKFIVSDNWSNPYSTMTNIFPLFNDLTGRNWDLWGDSISANAGYWHEQANQYLQMTLSINAVGGDEIADQVTDLDALLLATPTHFDDKALVTCMAIYNTWNQGYTLGTSADSTATASYCGKLKYFIETVLTANELLHLVLMTQYITVNTTNINGDTLADFNEKTREIALLYGLPLIDWGKDSGCNPINAGTSASSSYDRLKFTGDGIHPGRWGGEILAKYFAKQLLTRVQTFF